MGRGHHAVGVLKLGEGKYAVFDQIIPKNKPERSVPAKIQNAEKIIKSGRTVSYDQDIAIPIASMIDIGQSRPLGLSRYAI